jgi:hypothetical protein
MEVAIAVRTDAGRLRAVLAKLAPVPSRSMRQSRAAARLGAPKAQLPADPARPGEPRCTLAHLLARTSGHAALDALPRRQESAGPSLWRRTSRPP